ncbi:MAG: class I SAM-dependent methyltransferase [Clostridium sp.]|nr:class I SAM-dependent methyltransferase [Clostridium sp.]
MPQNIYDNEIFFTSFKELRETDSCYNVLLEQPAMKNLLPELQGRRVLDLGCGLGINCMDFVNAGASAVIGVDVSSRMLEIASTQNSNPKITYMNMPLENLHELDGKYDLIYSSLCFNYIENFEKLIADIYNLLNDNGVLLFSQEHPIVTASAGIHSGYLRDGEGNPYAYCISDYHNESIRKENWFVDGVIKYHRTFSTVMNTLCNAGFVIENIAEPVPDEDALLKRPGLSKEFIKPTFLIVKAKKC